jgi:pentapeptide MXKDX repeat protein
VRRFATLALSLSLCLTLLLGLGGAPALFAQDEAKKDEAKKEEPKKDEAKKDEPKKDEPKKDEAKKDEPKKDEPKAEEPKKEEAPKPIPPEVEKKLAEARRAVAEAIVAAQDAGLVNTTIEPPPILDILITGRATDESALKARTGVSPEVFGAWFTNQGKPGQNINPQTDVRIIQPSAGLKAWYDQRAAMLNREIEAVRKAKGTPAPAEAKKDEEKKDEPKKDEAKKDEEKKDESK